jgi:tRNA pseudouridine13 synthase
LHVPRLDESIGIEVYATNSRGIGGVIRQTAEDFTVEEVLVDGSKAQVRQTATEPSALGSSKRSSDTHLLCVLVKRNWDTFSAVKALADQLNISASRIHVAGLKDAKAVTAQYVTIDGVSSENVQTVCLKDIEVRPVGYFRERLSSYYLLGNRFAAAITRIKQRKSTIRKSIARTIEELTRIGGVPNFFGHQRFGTIRPITHSVGKAIVKGNFRKAAILFLAKPSPHEHPESRGAREALANTLDFKEALLCFPKQLRYERQMLKHLAVERDDYVGAFRMLPTKLLKLFPQAYQSYLFNRFLSKRMEAGLPLDKTEIGDYAIKVERSGLPVPNMFKAVTHENHREIDKAVVSGKMRLVIPLIGFRSQPFLGVQGEIEEEILRKEGISPGDYQVSSMPEVSLRGELRTALAPIMNLSISEIVPDSNNLSKLRVRADFMLYRSSYATVVLRELMKPTSPLEAGF